MDGSELKEITVYEPVCPTVTTSSGKVQIPTKEELKFMESWLASDVK